MSQGMPYVTTGLKVEPEWIDYNGHLNMAYYNVLFDLGVDGAFETFGLGPDYVKAHNASYYTLENHVVYLREIHDGDDVDVSFQLLDYDAKRTHAFLELIHAKDGFVSATSEQIHMHVDMNQKRSSPFPDAVLERIGAMHAAHRPLPVKPQVGRVIGIPRKSAKV